LSEIFSDGKRKSNYKVKGALDFEMSLDQKNDAFREMSQKFE
jgi:hypothetical protein